MSVGYWRASRGTIDLEGPPNGDLRALCAERLLLLRFPGIASREAFCMGLSGCLDFSWHSQTNGGLDLVRPFVRSTLLGGATLEIVQAETSQPQCGEIDRGAQADEQ